MNHKKPQMSVTTQTLWMSVAVGALWIGVGITRALEGIFDNLIVQIVHYTLLASTFVCLFIVLSSNPEEDDEMSELNHIKAKAKSKDLMNIVYCASAVLSALVFSLLQYGTNADVHWAKIIIGMCFIFMGIQDIITGIVFRRLEAE